MIGVCVCVCCSPPASASLPAGPPPQVLSDDAEQQAALLLACSGDRVPPPLRPVGVFDLLEALQVRLQISTHSPKDQNFTYELNSNIR